MKRWLVSFFDWQIHDRLFRHKWPNCKWVAMHSWWGDEDD